MLAAGSTLVYATASLGGGAGFRGGGAGFLGGGAGFLGEPALATVRTDVAGYLSTLILVYTLLIVLYIVMQLLFAFGFRPPYSRVFDSFLTFLRDVCEPYLRIFRRVIPQIGMFDFSPIVAIFVLTLLNTLLVQGVIHG